MLKFISYLKKEIVFLKNYYFNYSISNEDLSMFFRSVCEFMKFNENVVFCLESSLHNIHNDIAKTTFKNVISNIKKGVLISESFNQAKIFNNVIINILKTGEKSNNLSSSFSFILEFLQKRQEQSSKIQKALFYPCFTFCVFLLTIGMFAHFIIPSLIELVVQMNNALVARFVFVRRLLLCFEFLFILMMLFNFLMLFLQKYNRNKFEYLCLNIFIFRDIFIYENLYFTTYYIKSALQNQLSIDEALDVALESSGYIFNSLLKKVKQDLLKGNELSVCFKYFKFIPQVFIDILHTGEKSNNLISSFETANVIFGNYYDAKINYFVERFPTIMITLIAVFLICFIWFLMFPLYSLGV